MSASAKRDGMHLVAVIMGADSRDIRNEAARQLLDFGFANYSLYESKEGNTGEVRVLGGTKDSCQLKSEGYSVLLPKGKNKDVQKEVLIEDEIKAPVEPGQKVGTVRYICRGDVIGETDITAAEEVDRIGYFGLLLKMLSIYCLK